VERVQACLHRQGGSSLKKWVQNHVVELPNEAAADGIGEPWFDSTEARSRGMRFSRDGSRRGGRDAIPDMQRTYALVVRENVVVDEELAASNRPEGS
jgi:hypothetical protein